ncbi:unnamed protein product, partial [Ceratitis capitata]
SEQQTIVQSVKWIHKPKRLAYMQVTGERVDNILMNLSSDVKPIVRRKKNSSSQQFTVISESTRV